MTKKQLMARLRSLVQAIDSIGGTKESDDLRRLLDAELCKLLNVVAKATPFNETK